MTKRLSSSLLQGAAIRIGSMRSTIIASSITASTTSSCTQAMKEVKSKLTEGKNNKRKRVTLTCTTTMVLSLPSLRTDKTMDSTQLR